MTPEQKQIVLDRNRRIRAERMADPVRAEAHRRAGREAAARRRQERLEVEGPRTRKARPAKKPKPEHVKANARARYWKPETRVATCKERRERWNLIKDEVNAKRRQENIERRKLRETQEAQAQADRIRNAKELLLKAEQRAKVASYGITVKERPTMREMA